MILNRLPTYAPPSILPPDYNLPSCIDHTSQFFHILTAPYRPPPSLSPWRRTTPQQQDRERCTSMVVWQDIEEDSASSVPQDGPSQAAGLDAHLAKDYPIYVPHGPWAWAAGEDIQQTETLLFLRQGSMCSAYIQTGVIAQRKITFISRRWNLDKQAEWIGFRSEMALYSSEQYLKPLQGGIVPRIIGVHILPGAISIAMELPHQSFWIEASPSMPDMFKERAMEGLEMLHSRGILHGDIELRHILIGADGAVTFIDFQLSRTATPDASVGLEKAEEEEFRFEKRMLAFKLDLNGARARETHKTEAFVQRTKRNKRRDQLWKRRAQGTRTGYISPYEEEPEHEKIEPPVHPQDFRDAWIKGSDAPPARIIVPGQSEEDVRAAIRTFLDIPEGPRILQHTEHKHIQNSSKQVDTLAPRRNSLKRERDDDIVQCFLPPADSSSHTAPVATTPSATSSTLPPPRKKARTTGRLKETARALSPLSQLSDPLSSKTSNQASNCKPMDAYHLADQCSHKYAASGVDFTPPSWRRLSLWIGSLVSW